MRVRTVCLVVVSLCVALNVGAQSRTVRLVSKVLGETRVVHIGVPPNYRLARQRYPVVLLLDGQARPFFDLTVAAVGYDLIGDVHDYAMPQQIVVGVEQGDRSADLSRNDTAFLRFLTDELLPYVDREYRTVPYRTLMGHSLGGRFALLALCRAPAQFSATIAISPSVSDPVASAVMSCVHQQSTQPSTRLRQLVLSAGSLELRSLAGVQRLEGFLRDSVRSHWRVRRVDGEGLGAYGNTVRHHPGWTAIRFCECNVGARSRGIRLSGRTPRRSPARTRCGTRGGERARGISCGSLVQVDDRDRARIPGAWTGRFGGRKRTAHDCGISRGAVGVRAAG